MLHISVHFLIRILSTFSYLSFGVDSHNQPCKYLQVFTKLYLNKLTISSSILLVYYLFVIFQLVFRKDLSIDNLEVNMCKDKSR